MFGRFTLAMMIGLGWYATPLQAQNSALGNSLSKTYQKVVSSVVYIEVGNLLQRTGSGSGFILHEDGYIATAAHLVETADVVRVTFHDGTMCGARIVTICAPLPARW